MHLSYLSFRLNTYIALLIITTAGALAVFVILHVANGESYKALAAHATELSAFEQ